MNVHLEIKSTYIHPCDGIEYTRTLLHICLSLNYVIFFFFLIVIVDVFPLFSPSPNAEQIYLQPHIYIKKRENNGVPRSRLDHGPFFRRRKSSACVRLYNIVGTHTHTHIYRPY